MENKETFTNYSDFDNVLELEKRIQCLQDELMKVNAKVMSLEELLMLAENALSRCTCPDLKEQILSLLSSMQYFMSTTAATDGTTIPSSGRIDAATQCDGEYSARIPYRSTTSVRGRNGRRNSS